MGHKYVKEEDTFSTSQNGTVPKPTAQEVSDNKFLRADGSWQPGSGGATKLSELTDVNISTPVENQTLMFDTIENKFVNKAMLLSLLSDIDLTAISNGQILQYDANTGKFKNVNYPSPIKGAGDSGTGFYAFQIGSANASATEALFGTFHAYNDVTGFIFGRTQLCYFCYGTEGSIGTITYRNNTALYGSFPNKRYDTATGKLYFTVPAWGQLWFLGWLNGVTAKA